MREVSKRVSEVGCLGFASIKAGQSPAVALMGGPEVGQVTGMK